MSHRNILHDFLIAIFTAGLFLFAYRGFLQRGMLAFGDFPPFPEHASDALNTFFSSWHPLGYGSVTPMGLVLLLQGALILLFGNAVVAQKFFLLLPMPLAFITMYVFLNRFIGINPKFARFIASFVYAINPLTLGGFLGGAIGGLYDYAIFPLLFLYSFYISKGHKIRDVIIFTLLLSLSISFGSFLVLFLLPFVMFLLTWALIRKKLKFFLVVTIYFVVSFFLSFVLTLPWTLPAFQFFASPISKAGFAPSTALIESYVNDVLYTYSYPGSLSPFISIVTLEWVSTQLGYSTSNVMMLLGLILPILAFSPLLFEPDNKKFKYVIGFSSLAMLVILFIWLTHLKLTLGIFRAFPFLFAFRNPGFPSMLLSFAYSPLIAITIDAIRKRAGTLYFKYVPRNISTEYGNKLHHISLSLILCSLIASGIFTYNWPFFTGDMALSQTRGEVAELSEYVIPDVFYRAGYWINEQRSLEGFFRTLWLPWTYEGAQIKLRWIDPHTFSVPLGTGFNVPVMDYLGFTLKALVDEQTQHIGALLAPVNVKYIVVNLASREKGPAKSSGYYAYGDPKNFAKLLDEQKDVKLVVNETDFLIYKNNKFIPHVSVYEKALLVAQPLGSTSEDINQNLRSLLLLSSAPGFNIDKILVVFEDQLPFNERKLFLKNSDAVIILQDDLRKAIVNMSQYSEIKKYILVSPINSTKELFFGDNFDNDLSRWSIKGGNWSLIEGKLSQSDNLLIFGHHPYIVANATSRDVYVETMVTIKSGGQLSPMILLRYNDTNNFYAFLGDARDNQLIIGKMINGAWVSLWNGYGFTQNINETYSLGASVIGDTLSIYLNGNYVTSVIDKDLIEGRLALGTYEANVNFDYVKAYQFIDKAYLMIPKTGWYKMATRSTSANINGANLNFTQMNYGDDNNKWYESEPIYLKDGTHEVSFPYGNIKILDSILAFSIDSKNDTLVNFFAPKFNVANLSVQKLSETEYQVQIKADNPVFIVLGEPYHLSWNGYVSLNKLTHFTAFLYANGFYLDKMGGTSLKIVFEKQNARNLQVTISAMAWTLLLVSLSYVSKSEILRLYKLVRKLH